MLSELISTIKDVCFVLGNSTSTSIDSSFWEKVQDLYWPWWILVALSAIILTSLLCCIIFACMRKRKKQAQVENSKQEKDGNIDNTKTDSLHPLEKKNGTTKRGVKRINVESIKATNGLDF